jgi:hypothetical protein
MHRLLEGYEHDVLDVCAPTTEELGHIHLVGRTTRARGVGGGGWVGMGVGMVGTGIQAVHLCVCLCL